MKNWKTGLASVLLAAGVIAGAPQGAKADGGELHIYNWTDYTSPEMVKKFEDETGIKVTIDTYDSNETALAKLQGQGASKDQLDALRTEFRTSFKPEWVTDVRELSRECTRTGVINELRTLTGRGIPLELRPPFK